MCTRRKQSLQRVMDCCVRVTLPARGTEEHQQRRKCVYFITEIALLGWLLEALKTKMSFAQRLFCEKPNLFLILLSFLSRVWWLGPEASSSCWIQRLRQSYGPVSVTTPRRAAARWHRDEGCWTRAASCRRLGHRAEWTLKSFVSETVESDGLLLELGFLNNSFLDKTHSSWWNILF